jgi:hypothetical protein
MSRASASGAIRARQPPAAVAGGCFAVCFARKSPGRTGEREVICPVCRSTVCRRSKRRGLRDLLGTLAGLRPWRCRTCNSRFYGWTVPLRFAAYVHCPRCGNLDLKHVARDRVAQGLLRRVYRAVGVPAYRCDGCRNRFFSLRFHRRIVPTRDASWEQPLDKAAAEDLAGAHREGG